MGRKAKTDLETELKRIEEEAREKARKAEELRERIKRTRIDDFARWCKRNGIDPMQFYKLAITAEWGGKVKALYAEMTAPPVGVIKPEPELVKTETEISAEDNIDDNESIDDESIEDETDEVEEDIDEKADDGEIEEEEEEDNGGEGNKESSLY